ncbi:MAG: hypothetical protein PVI57_17915 [Gemmatimonadota bacterium]|jgi:hypothetical protein
MGATKWRSGTGGGNVRWTLGVALVAGMGGCSGPSTGPVPDALLEVVARHGLVFMTQNVDENDRMEALFRGPVVVDTQGCLRLGRPDGATAVWPRGYALETSGDVARVMDERGEPVGWLGDDFELAGGEVEGLHDRMGFTDADRERARTCPGRYWIVNPRS